MTGHLLGILVFLLVTLSIALINYFFLRRLQDPKNAAAKKLTRVSILLPVRNESANARDCVCSLLTQDYPDFEVLVLDDHSTDDTRQILERLADENDRLRVLQGETLPEGWLGKLWGNHQLAQAATGELFLFTDADTRHQPGSLRQAVAMQQSQSADLLTILPYQGIHSLGENLLVPVLYWSLMCFLPVPLAERVRLPALSFAIGQYLLLKRETYQSTGGFAAVRDTPADDLALARRVKAAGLRWRIADSAGQVSTRMYTSWESAFEGIGKNLIAAFDYRVLPFLFVWLWLLVVYLHPPLIVLSSLLKQPGASDHFTLALLATAVAALQWGLVIVRFRFPIRTLLLYPAIVATSVLTALQSLRINANGKATWKGRTLVQPRLKWF